MARGRKRGGASAKLATRGRVTRQTKKKSDEVITNDEDNGDAPEDKNSSVLVEQIDKCSVVVSKRSSKKKSEDVTEENGKSQEEKQCAAPLEQINKSFVVVSKSSTNKMSEDVSEENANAQEENNSIAPHEQIDKSYDNKSSVVVLKRLHKKFDKFRNLSDDKSHDNDNLEDAQSTITSVLNEIPKIVNEDRTNYNNLNSVSNPVINIEKDFINLDSVSDTEINNSVGVNKEIVDEMVVVTKVDSINTETEKVNSEISISSNEHVSNINNIDETLSNIEKNYSDNQELLTEEDLQEETTVVFAIIEDCDEDSSNNLLLDHVAQEEISYDEHPEVVSYEVEIEETFVVPPEEKMVVDSSIFEQHECNLQFDQGEIDYSDNSSDKDESMEVVSFDSLKKNEESQLEENASLTDFIPNTSKEDLPIDLPKTLDEKINLNVDEGESCVETAKSSESITQNPTDNSTEVLDKSVSLESSGNCVKTDPSLELSEISPKLEPSTSTEESSPIIRRSNRIKTISVLKKKSKGHGLVRNDKFKRIENIADKEISSDSASTTENQVDKINPSIIKPISKDQITSDNSDSDLKPVKVKSRWRRTSELEMANPSTNIISESQQANLNDSAKHKTTEELQFEKDMEERLRQFVQLQENEYRCEKTVCKEAKKMLCDCFLTAEEIARGEMGCGEDCLNRLLMIECGPNCVVGNRCTNKRFQESQYATCKVFKTEKKGFGIQATMDMAPAG